MGGEAAGHRAPECPVHRPELSARISERRPEFNGGGRRLVGQDPGYELGRRSQAWPETARYAATEIRTQSRRPISTQSWVRRRSAMLMASQMPIAVSATVKAKAAILASMRWRKSSGSSRGRS